MLSKQVKMWIVVNLHMRSQRYHTRCKQNTDTKLHKSVQSYIRKLMKFIILVVKQEDQFANLCTKMRAKLVCTIFLTLMASALCESDGTSEAPASTTPLLPSIFLAVKNGNITYGGEKAFLSGMICTCLY